MNQIRCPECDQKLKIDAGRARSAVRCSSCGHRVRLDDASDERVTADPPPRKKKADARHPPSQVKIPTALLPFGIVLVVGIMFQLPIFLSPALALLAMLVGLGIIIYGFVQACQIASRQGYNVSIDYLEGMGPLKWVLILGFFGLYVLGYWLQWVIGHVVIATRKPKTMVPWLAVQGYGFAVILMAVIVGTISDRMWRAVHDATAALQAGTPNAPLGNNAKPPPTPAPRVTGDADLDRLLADLDSTDAATFNAAAERLAKMEPNQHKAVVANKLAGKVERHQGYPRSLAVGALKVWATPNEVPLLIRLLGDPDVGTRNEVLQVIGKFQDERAAQPVARCFVEFQTRYHGEQALRQMGPVAEKDVAAILTQPERGMYIPAIDVLAAIGTEKSVPALEAAARDQDAVVQIHAREALAVIKGRMNK